MPLSHRRPRSLPSAGSPIKDKNLKKTIKHATYRRQSKVLKFVCYGGTAHTTAHLHALWRRNTRPHLDYETDESSSVNSAGTLERPNLSVIDPIALAYAGLDPVLANIGPVNVRRYLAEISSDLFASVRDCITQPFPKVIGTALPKFIAVKMSPVTHRSYYPTHVLAVHTTQASSSRCDATFFPVHALLFAAHCCRMPPLPPPIGAPKSDDALLHYVPLIPLRVPSKDTFSLIVMFLYSNDIMWLVCSLLPAWTKTDFSGCQTLQDKLDRVVEHLAANYSINTLIGQQDRVKMFYDNACALGVVRTCVWDVIDLVWGCYNRAVDRLRD